MGNLKDSQDAKEPIVKQKKEGFDIDPILFALGSNGLGFYQVSQMVLALMGLPGVAFSILSVVFIGYQPPHRCAEVNTSRLEAELGLSLNHSDQLHVHYDKCAIRVGVNQSDGQDLRHFELPCLNGFDYEGGKHTSFFTEWDLTCERSGLTELTQTLMMVGQGAGAFLLTSTADRVGRKMVCTLSTLGILLVSTATALSPNYWFLLVCRIILGALQQGSGLVGFTIFIEIVPKWMRRAAGVIDGTAWAGSVMLMPLLAYLLQNYSWRYLQFAFAAFSLHSLFLPWLLDESLRWLVANQRKEAAEKVLKKASRRNGVDYEQVHAALETVLAEIERPREAASEENCEKLIVPNPDKVSMDQSKKTLGENPGHDDPEIGVDTTKLSLNGDVGNGAVPAVDEGKVEVKKYTLLDIFRHGVMRKVAGVIWYVWVTNSLMYYGLILTSSSLAGDRFVNFFLQGMVELPAYITVFWALKRFGRRNVACSFQALAALSLLLSSVILATVKGSVVGPITNALSLVGKFGVSGSFGTIFIFCPELFPTNLRTAGLGMSSAFARIGGMVAPYSTLLADIVLWGPGLIFGSMSALASYIMLKLPETRGRPLPTTIEEIKAWKPLKFKKGKLIYEETIKA